MTTKNSLLLTLFFALPLNAQTARFPGRRFRNGLADFKATPEERSFEEQMVHIAGSLFERFSQISGIAPVKSVVPKTITKEFAIEWLNQSFDYVIQVLGQLFLSFPTPGLLTP